MANDIFTTDSELSAATPSLWTARFYQVKRELLPFQSVIDRSYEGEITSLGQVLNISEIPDFSDATLLTEGAVADADAVTVTQHQLTINKLAHKDVILTKQAMVQSLPMMNELRDKCIFSILKKMEADIIAAIVPSASAPDHTIAWDSGTTLGLADVQEAKELLDEADCPMDNRHMVIGSEQYADLFSITGVTSRDFIPAGSPLSSGQVQVPFLGFQVHLATRVGDVGYFFHPSFLTMAVQRQLEVSQHDLNPQGIRGTRINCDVLYGLLQMDDERVVKIG
jgi:hypothetical protein